MKRTALAVLLTLTALPAAAQTAYPLYCRGGGEMMGSFNAAGGVTLNILPGTSAAGFGVAAAGKCRWTDRAFHADEPRRLALSAGSPAQALTLIGWALRGEMFVLQAYNDGAGNLRITRFGA